MKTYKELLSQFDELRREIEVSREQEARLISERVMALLTESGVDIRNFLQPERLGKRSRGTREPKYLDPKTGATWCGRGRRPLWLAGKNKDEFLLSK